MVENAALRLREARQQKYYVTFSDAEFEYVSRHPSLSATEKLIWFNLARKSHLHPEMVWSCSHQQVAAMVGGKPFTAYRAIRKLKEMGFLTSYFDPQAQINIVRISFPAEGLNTILAAPLRGENKRRQEFSAPIRDLEKDNKAVISPAKMQGPPCKNAPPLPAKMQGLLINNNNIKHNIHNLSEEVITPELPIVKNANALLDDYQKLQNEYSELPLRERIKAVSAYFTPEQLNLIHTQILEGAKVTSIKAQKEQKASSPLVVQGPPINHHAIPLQTKLIHYEFDNERYLIEEQVKNQIFIRLPVLYHQGKFKGEAGKKPIKTLISEILFYITKAGSNQSQSTPQLKRYFVARKLCMQGLWERPRGMLKKEICAKEQQWNAVKRMEIEAAVNGIRILSCN